MSWHGNFVSREEVGRRMTLPVIWAVLLKPELHVNLLRILFRREL